MYLDLQFQSTWQYFKYVVPSLRSDKNPVPKLTFYNNVKAFKCSTLSYFVGYGDNNECHIFEPVFLQNCIPANNKRLFLQKYINKIDMNPNKRYKILY